MDCVLHGSIPIYGGSAGHSTLVSPGKTSLPLQRTMENKGLITTGGYEALLIFVIFSL